MSIKTKCICDRCKKDMIESRLISISLGVGTRKVQNSRLVFYVGSGNVEEEITMKIDLCEQCMEELVNWIGLPPVKNTEAYQ